MEMQVDSKTVERVRKLLNLARDGGATEAEASLAMERAQEIMLANNLSMAVVELSGGPAAEARTKDGTEKRANYRWQREIMSAIAQANFCHLRTLTEQRRIRGDNMRDFATGYEIIGRISNVVSSRTMYEYLLQTCSRLRSEFEAESELHTKRDGALFVEGLSDRLSERIKDRHEEKLRAQREEAERQKREQEMRARHPSAAPSGTALVVVLEDYAQKEADLNNDLANGWAAGTTTAKRAEAERQRAQRQREWEEKNKQMNALIAQGVDSEVAYDMMHLGWSRLKAEAYEAKQREKGPEPKARAWRGGGGRSREDRLRDRLHTSSAQAGRRKAESVGLDPQVAAAKTARRIK